MSLSWFDPSPFFSACQGMHANVVATHKGLTTRPLAIARHAMRVQEVETRRKAGHCPDSPSVVGNAHHLVQPRLVQRADVHVHGMTVLHGAVRQCFEMLNNNKQSRSQFEYVTVTKTKSSLRTLNSRMLNQIPHLRPIPYL